MKIVKAVALFVLLVVAIALPARCQEIRISVPVHTAGAFDPTKPLLSLLPSTNQTGHLIDLLNSSGATVSFIDVTGLITAPITTPANCSSAASPAVCGAAPAGSVVIAAAGTTVTVNTTAVTANSQILVAFDESLGTKLGVTCNSASASEAAQYFVSARSAGSSFTLKTSVAPTTNPACLSYLIAN